MTFTIIGTGNMAWFIGTRLVAARHLCKGVFGRNEAAVKRLSEGLLSNKHGDLAAARDTEADVCFIAVTDDAIAEVAAKLNYKKTVLVHTAGAVQLDVLQNAAPDSAILWPVYSISGSNPPSHRNIPIAWEASSPKAEKYALSLGHVITDILFEAKYDQRKWLHLSAVISNNFTNHLMTICERICAENALPFSALEPIIEQTFSRFRQAAPSTVQTGPAIRGDVKTITEQTELLAGHEDWQKIYTAITESIQKTHPEKG
ncbi:DUF2520 domain-containing protein [Nemorincola caseinilytica]|uniref:DUF2520 domain-containing protein n=1 Tax=Nemorincola caseinilytica TaxID=2054315 RepID=A0ABP8N562_9BACT